MFFKLFFSLVLSSVTPKESITIYFVIIRCFKMILSQENPKKLDFLKMRGGAHWEAPKKLFLTSLRDLFLPLKIGEMLFKSYFTLVLSSITLTESIKIYFVIIRWFQVILSQENSKKLDFLKMRGGVHWEAPKKLF